MTAPRRRSARNAPARPDPETYVVGTWAGKPNYGCPFCTFRTLDGAGEVVTHIALLHRAQAAAAPEATAPQES